MTAAVSKDNRRNNSRIFVGHVRLWMEGSPSAGSFLRPGKDLLGLMRGSHRKGAQLARCVNPRLPAMDRHSAKE